jgi:hypothetical protein
LKRRKDENPGFNIQRISNGQIRRRMAVAFPSNAPKPPYPQISAKYRFSVAFLPNGTKMPKPTIQLKMGSADLFRLVCTQREINQMV